MGGPGGSAMAIQFSQAGRMWFIYPSVAISPGASSISLQPSAPLCLHGPLLQPVDSDISRGDDWILDAGTIDKIVSILSQ